MVSEHGYGAWSEPLLYQPNIGLPFGSMRNAVDNDDYMHNNSIV